MFNRLYWWPHPQWLFVGVWIALVSLPTLVRAEPPATESAGEAIASDTADVPADQAGKADPLKQPNPGPTVAGTPDPGRTAIKLVPGQSPKPAAGAAPLPERAPAETAGDDTSSKPEEKPLEIVPAPDLFYAKPMSVEEAALQLDLSEDDFITFRNARTDEVNVVFKHGPDSVGWIHP